MGHYAIWPLQGPLSAPAVQTFAGAHGAPKGHSTSYAFLQVAQWTQHFTRLHKAPAEHSKANGQL